jgi:hypothetical protein
MSLSVWVKEGAMRGARLSAPSAQLSSIQSRIRRARKSRQPGFDDDFERTVWLIFSPGRYRAFADDESKGVREMIRVDT